MIVAPVMSVMLACARMLPAKKAVVTEPRAVAEVPTCQNTLQPWAPLINKTLEPLAVVNGKLLILKMKIELGLPSPVEREGPGQFANELKL